MPSAPNEELEEIVLSKIRKLSKNINRDSYSLAKNLQADFLAKSIISSENDLQNEFVETCIKVCSAIGLETTLETNLYSSISPSGLVVISNHIGLNKLTKISKNDLERHLRGLSEIDIIEEINPLVNDDPFIMLFAPIVAAISSISINFKLHFTIITMEYPEPYSNIVSRTGGIVINSFGAKKYRSILSKALEIKERCLNDKLFPIYILFPEGGTSGKRHGGSPYDLEHFKSGYSRLAYNLNMPILPIVTYLNKFSDLTNRILEPKPCSADYDIREDQRKMQEVLNKYAL